jgi:hypothetical protein
MAKVKLELGAELDLLNKHELGDTIDAKVDAWQRYKARGLKRQPFQSNAQVAGAALLIGDSSIPQGQAGARILGPNEGWAWKVTRISVTGFAAATTDYVKIYKGDVGAGSPQSDPRFVDTLTFSRWAVYPGHGCILVPGDHIVIAGGAAFTGSALASPDGTLWTVTGEAIAAPADQIWKLIGG